MSIIKVMVNVAKIEKQLPLNNISLPLVINAERCIWVAFSQGQLGIATQMSLVKVKVTVAKNRNTVYRLLYSL